MSATNSLDSEKIAQLRAEQQRVLNELEMINRKFEKLAAPILKARPAKFQFYERVVVLQDAPEIFGKSGSILGRARADDGTWFYTVFIVGSNETWDIAESDLETTGIIDKREDLYTGKNMRVRVDKTGRGARVKASRGKSPSQVKARRSIGGAWQNRGNGKLRRI